MKHSNTYRHYNRQPINEESLMLYITCINCNSRVLFDNIDQHAAKCIKATNEVIMNSNRHNSLQSVNYKLKKLKEHLTNIITDSIALPKDKVIVNTMKGISKQLAHCITESLHIEEIDLISIRRLKEIIRDIDCISKTKGLIVANVINIDQTRVLVNEKLKVYREQFRLRGNDDKTKGNGVYESHRAKIISLANSGPYEFNSEIQMKKSNDNDAYQQYNEGDIGNEVNDSADTLQHDLISYEGVINYNTNTNNNTKPNYIMSTNTSMSHISKISREDNDKDKDKDKDTVSITVNSIYSESDSLKHSFYKAVFKLKLERLHSSHKGQLISHTLLWKECNKLQIPKSKWKSFIIEELNNPNKYYQYNKPIRNKRQYQSQSIPSMGTINEEA